MFSRDRFIEDCRAAVAETDSHLAARELVARAVADPASIIAELGEPSNGTVDRIFVSPTLTIINLVWAPYMTLMPHDHRMWAVIGIYSGREDNVFWRRLPDAEDGRIEAAGAKDLGAGDVAPLGRDIIHSVTNPLPRASGAIHVYGGDFFSAPRSEWDPESLREGPYDVDKNVRLFEEFGRRAAGGAH